MSLLACLSVLGSVTAVSPLPPPPVRAETAAAVLTIDVRRPGPAVSPMLYGIFFEEINHAGDGGLYAELIENRSFEDDPNLPKSWTLRTNGDSEGTMALDSSQPLNPNNRRSLRLNSERSGGVGIANDGYWGIALKRGDRYRLSLYARADRRFGSGPLRVHLENARGKVSAEGRVEDLTTAWKRHTVTLTAAVNEPAARLVIQTATPGTVWLDMVSLFPEKTWKGRPNGLRADLAAKLAALKPAFVRFPGGCFVEGDTLADAYRWKETIGPIEARPGRPNLWGYRSTDGLGFHEYLQLCEDLSAKPLFVINCGMSHKENAPLSALDTWIQDALDAIEYANGPVTSRWGGLRAKHGHPRPFNLKYLQIGNENGGPAYDERYARFYDAVRARYPDMRIVANVWGGIPTSRPADLLDEHYYHGPDWFLQNARRYDRYDRTGPEIYVGEYAVTQNAGQGNLRAALAEAAFMAGMERNSDKVTMSSYAPLFVNVNDRKWNPDLIGFDSARAYGTPSYYVQKLFSENRPDVILPALLTTREKPMPVRGSIGLGTWRTRAEYREVTLTQNNRRVLTADFTRDGATGDWRVVNGEWSVEKGAYRQTSDGEDRRAVLRSPVVAGLSDYTLSLKARKLSGAEGFLVMFRVRDDNNWYWWNLGGWNNTRHAVEKTADGAKSIVSSEAPGRIETGRWYDIRIEARGARIRCYLDSVLVHDFEEQPAPPLHVAAGRAKTGGDIIVKVVNASDKARETTILLKGATALSPVATAAVLTGRNQTDENSVAVPTKIVPTVHKVRGVGREFRHTFGPHSLTILRIREGK